MRENRLSGSEGELSSPYPYNAIERKYPNLNSTTKAWIAAGIGILFSVGLIVWQVKASHAAAINLSPDDMTQIAQDQAPQARARLATDEVARKDFAKNVRELLAVESRQLINQRRLSCSRRACDPNGQRAAGAPKDLLHQL